MENKLTLEQTAPYLSYGVKVQWLRTEDNSYQISEFNFCDAYWLFKRAEFKLILHPLSDLIKHCEDLGFVPINMIRKEDRDFYIVKGDTEYIIRKEGLYGGWSGYRTTESLPYWLVQLLLKWHFDVHGLIEKKLAIDINTLKNGK